MSQTRHITAHGKLLITGEYFVLDGALALAVPTRYGQSMRITRHTDDDRLLKWRSLDDKGQEWFSGDWKWTGESFDLLDTSDQELAERLSQLFVAAAEQGAAIDQHLRGREVETRLEFPRDWGLGTSSTLISLLARYLEVDPYRLLADTFGGSGYDIACAEAEGPILYLRRQGEPQVMEREWFPAYSRQLYFVYLGQKQNSREGIACYRSRQPSKDVKEQITHLTFDLLEASTAAEAELVLRAHEALVSKAIGLPPVQEARFPDFPGTVKSLGAWGGDFVLVVSPWPAKKTRAYFNERGCGAVVGFDEMVL